MNLKRKFRIGLSILLLVAMILPFSVVGATDIESSPSWRRISNPGNSSIKDPDGLVEGGDRGNSYSWSMAETDEYVWIGMNRNLMAMSAAMILKEFLPEDKIPAVLKTLTMDEIPSDPETLGNNRPVIMRYNKNTEVLEKFYESAEFPPGYGYGEDYGYRVAKAFNGSVYFGTMAGSRGANRLLRFDDTMEAMVSEPEVVYTLPTAGAQTSIRAMDVYDDALYIGIITGTDQVEVKKSTNPGTDPWETVATTEDFDGLVKAGGGAIAGGGVFDLIPYNGYLYATIVTADTPPIGDNTYTGWGLYKGKPDANGNWNWEAVVSEPETGAKYPLGMGVGINTVATPFVFQGKLYVGTFNEPVHAMYQIFQGSVDAIYNSLQQGTQLYRFDENDQAEMVAGNPSEVFPNGSISGLAAGYESEVGTSTNLYSWRMAEYNGQLYVGTFDVYALYHMIARIPVRDFLTYTENGLKQNAPSTLALEEEGKEETSVLEDLTKAQDTLAGIRTEINQIKEENAIVPQMMSNDVEETLTETPVTINEVGTESDVNATTDSVTDVKKAETQENTNSNAPVANQKTEDWSFLDENFKLIDEKIAEVNLLMAETPTAENVSSIENLLKDISNLLGKVIEFSERIHILPQEVIDGMKSLKSVIDTVSELLGRFDFQKYLEINRILTAHKDKDEAGFDLLTSKDGVNFEFITKNGFENEYNYGIRTLQPTDKELIIGTANPFFGSQLWSIRTPKPPVNVMSVELDKKQAEIKINETIKLNTKVFPEIADDKTVTWKSSDEKVAIVDGNGQVKGISEGKAWVTVTTNDQGKTATCEITVKKENSGGGGNNENNNGSTDNTGGNTNNKVTPVKGSPATGLQNNTMIITIVLVIVCCLAAIGIIVVRRKKMKK